MKRIFLSVPMRDRTDEQIKFTIEKMKQVLTAMFGCEYIEFVHNLMSEDDCKQLIKEATRDNGEVMNKSLVYLGEAIRKMASCDYVAVIRSPFIRIKNYKGCDKEEEIAGTYDLKIIRLDDPTGEIYLPEAFEEYNRMQKLLEEKKNQMKEELNRCFGIGACEPETTVEN